MMTFGAFMNTKFGIGIMTLFLLLTLRVGLETYALASLAEPTISDPLLIHSVVAEGLEMPTAMAFLGPDDILVAEKNTGLVKRIVNGNVLKEPLLDVNVANQIERGLLGMAVSKNITTDKTYVFLFYTESPDEREGEQEDDEIEGNAYATEEENRNVIGNHLYRYELVNGKLANSKRILDLPYSPGPAHNGGVITIGPDNNVYIVVGNLFSPAYNEGGEMTLAQNIKDAEGTDGRGGIIRVTQDGDIVVGENGKRSILGDEHPLDMYYAYGIRNSFGIDFDPITGHLWDTENGPNFGDEINLVEPGFNSGWKIVQGMSYMDDEFDEDGLVSFNGKGKYSEPEFVWSKPVAPTGILFFHSDKLGSDYENDMFVADAGGRIYHFDLNKDRTSLALQGQLRDKIAQDEGELERITFASGFSTITDLEVGADGYLYVLSYRDGKIYRITSG